MHYTSSLQNHQHHHQRWTQHDSRNPLLTTTLSTTRSAMGVHTICKWKEFLQICGHMVMLETYVKLHGIKEMGWCLMVGGGELYERN